MDERSFRHHRNRFNAVIEKLRGQILLRQTVIVKVLRQLVQKLLFQYGEVMTAQIILFAVKDIEIPRLFLRKVIFQLCKPIGSSFRLFCHGLPRNHNVSVFIRAQQQRAGRVNPFQHLRRRMPIGVFAHADNDDFR